MVKTKFFLDNTEHVNKIHGNFINNKKININNN